MMKKVKKYTQLHFRCIWKQIASFERKASIPTLHQKNMIDKINVDMFCVVK